VLKDGAIVVRRLVTVRQQVMKQENRTTQDGKTVTVAVPALVPVTREATLSLDPKALTVETTDGKTVEPAEWEKRLKEGKVKVIVLPSDKPVPEAVRKANKDAVLILRVKAKP
jgi:uncharacterized protein (DUF58 family)